MESRLRNANDPDTWGPLPGPSHPDFDSAEELCLLQECARAVLRMGPDWAVGLNVDEPFYPCVEVYRGGIQCAEIHVVLGVRSGDPLRLGVFAVGDLQAELYAGSAAVAAAHVAGLRG